MKRIDIDSPFVIIAIAIVLASALICIDPLSIVRG
jgi:hypothetical protein